VLNIPGVPRIQSHAGATSRENKSNVFGNALQESKELINEAVVQYVDTTAPGFSVINTLSWQRDGIVSLTPAQSAAGDRVMDDQ